MFGQVVMYGFMQGIRVSLERSIFSVILILHSVPLMSHAHVGEITKKQRRQSVLTRRPLVEGGESLKGDRSTAAWSRPVPRDANIVSCRAFQFA